MESKSLQTNRRISPPSRRKRTACLLGHVWLTRGSQTSEGDGGLHARI